MNKRVRAIKNKILAEEKRFSPKGISDKYGLSLKYAEETCQELASEYPFIKTQVNIKCPECGIYRTGMNSETLSSVEYFDCEECGYEFSKDEAILLYYYFNEKLFNRGANPQKKKSHDQNEIEYELLQKYKNKPVDEELLESDGTLIWHISDLHLSYRRRRLAGNHCNSLKFKFIDILKCRKNIENDIFVISGDCTTTGSKKDLVEFNVFLEELKNVGVRAENILVTPGNHDAWRTGSYLSFSRVMQYLFLILIRGKLLVYLKRIPFFSKISLFSERYDGDIKIVKKNINGITFNFHLVNTCVNFEMSRGVFPQNLPLVNNNDTNVLVMHHHLNELGRDEAGVFETNNLNFILNTAEKIWNRINKVALRVINPNTALEYIKDNNIKLVLHGHQHFQHFGHNEPHVLASPSLLIEEYCKNTGNDHFKNMIGFNLIYARTNKASVFFYRYKNHDFLCDNLFYDKNL